MMTRQPKITRRAALRSLSAMALLATAQLGSQLGSRRAWAAAPRRMTIDLMCGMVGVQADQRTAVELAIEHGFESVEAMPRDLAALGRSGIQELLARMKAGRVVFGAAGLPVDFRQDEPRFAEGLKALPKLAEALQMAGVRRVGTWLMPGSQTLTYRQHFQLYAARLREIARVLADHGCQLGLEYVGPKTSRDRFRFHFIHTMAETMELIAEMGQANAGLVLDSWHWWHAGDTEQDILALRPAQIVAVDLNDAPAGIPKEKQLDGQRELPVATGVIDVKPFLGALQKIGYDGPVRAEPFNKALNELDNGPACAKVAASLRAAMALIAP